MKLREIYKLSHREYTAYKTRSRATVITIGILFGLLLGILFVTQGLENTVMRYAGEATGGKIYLASVYDVEEGDNFIRGRAGEYEGRIIDLTEEQKQEVGEELSGNTVVIEFKNLTKAYEYYSKTDAAELKYDKDEYHIVELFGNQMTAYRYFRDHDRDYIRPASLVLLSVSAFILAFTMAHLIASSTRTFVLYRSIGASKKQLLIIYFVYLLELCVKAVLFAILAGFAIGGIATGLGWNYLSEQLAQYYPNSQGHPLILIGFNLRCLEAVLSMFIAAPISFLLCLDQFSNKKIAQKLKGD